MTIRHATITAMPLNGQTLDSNVPGYAFPERQTVAVIGGGVSGAAVAYHLSHLRPASDVAIVVFEPRSEIGRGLAYDTADPAHRVNVPAARMSLHLDEPDHFSRWIERNHAAADDPAALAADGSLYPRRSVFGAYVNDLLRPALESGAVRHVRSAVTGLCPDGKRWTITDASGAVTSADIVVIATTHPPPSPPRALVDAIGHHPRFVADATVPGALAVVRPDDRLLVVGNGLTSADVIASLARTGHRGPIVALSRRGLRSRGHAGVPQELFGDFATNPETTALALVRRIRATIRDAAKAGRTWHAVIDQVRAEGGLVWRALPVAERRRVVRHLRPFWDVHRFRIAPQVEAVLNDDIRSGRLEIVAGAIRDVATNGDTITAMLHPRGHKTAIERTFDAVVVTTGPAHGGILESQEWLGTLARSGHLTLDPTGLGIGCNDMAQAIAEDGRADETLFIAGPLARGQFGELMGLPQVAEQAALVAATVAHKIGQTAARGRFPS